MTFAEKPLAPTYLATYFTASIEDHEIPHSQHVRSGSLRQCMRCAARLDSGHPPEAEIHVYQHTHGAEPRLVAKRFVGNHYWTYVQDSL
jgi:hypothetical protein